MQQANFYYIILVFLLFDLKFYLDIAPLMLSSNEVPRSALKTLWRVFLVATTTTPTTRDEIMMVQCF